MSEYKGYENFHKGYYWKNRDIIRERSAAAGRKRKLTRPLYNAINAARSRSKKKGLDFDLIELDIIIPSHCPYLGIPLIRSDQSWNDNAPSIDRVNPLKGYTMDNIQVISALANRMKNNASVEQLITFAENVLKIHKGN